MAASNPYHEDGPDATRLPQPGRCYTSSLHEGYANQYFASQVFAVRGKMDIPDWRKKIDELDEQIVHLLSERAAAAVAIGQLKAESSAPIYEPQREQAVFQHVRTVNPGPLTGTQIQDVYERLMDVMRALQRPQ
jgi:chorismate mutase